MPTALNTLKVVAAVFAMSAALFFGYSVAGYVADTFSNAYAVNESGGGSSCSSCGGGWYWLDGGGWGGSTNYDGGGGGGGGGYPTPYCTLSITGPVVAYSHPPQYQYIATWSAPYATQFSIDNGIGLVTPPTGGTHTFVTSATSGTYTGTAVTPYGTVTCSGSIPPPPPNPPYCVLTPVPATIAAGATSTITWNTTSGVTFSVNNGVGNLTPVGGGSFVVSPLVTTTYIGTVTGSGYQTAQCQTTVTVIPPAECKLEITKSANKATVGANGTVEYTINIKNVGDKKCTGSGVKLVDVVDSRITYQSETHSANITAGYAPDAVYTAADRTLRFNAWDMDPGETGWVKWVGTFATPTQCSEVVPNKAKVTSYEYNNFTTWVESNTVNVTLTKDCTPPPPQCPAVQQTSQGLYPISGATTVEIDAEMLGSEAAYHNSFGYYLADANRNPIKGKIVWGNVHAPGTSHVVLNLSAGDTAGATYLAFFIIPNGGSYGFVNNENVTFVNSGGWKAFKNSVYIPTRFGDPLLNGGADYEKDAPGVPGNSNWEDKTDNDYNDVQVEVKVYACIPPPPPGECELEISKSANKATTTPNGTVEYTINIRNVGDKKCTGSGVKIEDALDPLATYQSEAHSANITAGYAPDPVYTSGNRTLHFNAWDMDPGETGWIKFVVTMGTPEACSVTVPNKARITSYEYNNFTTWVYSNIVNVTVEKDCTPPPTECKLEIEKSANKATTTPNDYVEYTINVKNVGGKKCTGSGVKIIDVLDSRLTYQSESHSANITAGYAPDPVYKSSNRTMYWNAWDLEPGEDGWVKFTVKVGTPTQCSEVIPNKAKVTALEYNNFLTWVESNTVNLTVTKNCYTPVPYCTMSVNPTALSSQGSATLSWNSTNVDTVSIDHGVGGVALSGSTQVTATTTTTYTGTFTGPGGTITCAATVTVNVPHYVPQCTLSVSASNINTGQSVIVSWTSQNVSSGYVTSVGTTTPVSGGSAEVFPADSTTFTGTFTGPHGNVTCTAPVTVQRGGGGCQGNCGGGLNQPNVVMLQKPPEAPLAFVTLDQIPYTGFEAGKALTLAFWLAVGLLAAITTYIVMGRGGVQLVLGGALNAVGVGRYDDVERGQRVATPLPNPFASTANRVNDNGYVQSVAAPVMPTPVMAPARTAVDGIPDITDVIESRAHGAGVLMSPESVARTLRLSPDRGEVLRIFGEVLNVAVKTLPREDGWIMLTSERFDELVAQVSVPQTVATPLSTPSVEDLLSSVMTPPSAPQSMPNVEMPMTGRDDQAVVMSLARAVLAGDRDGAYATVRNLEQSGAHATTVMTIIAGAYDQLYRARRHGLTTELSVSALKVSDAALAKMTELFVHGMDHAYTNAFTGLKLAVAQAFEARG